MPTPSPRRSRRKPPAFRRLFVEVLEDRTLLAAITGNVFDAVSGQPPVVGATVYLDLNGNGQFDIRETFQGSTTVQAINEGQVTGFSGAPLTVSGVSTQFSHVIVGLDLSSTGTPATQQLLVVLISPQGSLDAAGPNLVQLNPGESFDGTFDDNAAVPVSAASSPYQGSFQPLQALNSPSLDVYSPNPNGTWQLLVTDPNFDQIDGSGITISNWSLTFTNPEPSTTTGADGSYSFSGLDAGNYTVAVAGPRTASVSVAVSAGETIYLQVLGANSGTGSFNVELDYTNTLPALRNDNDGSAGSNAGRALPVPVPVPPETARF